MKKAHHFLSVVIITVLSVSLMGCEKTPDEISVTTKNKDNVANYENAENEGKSLREMTNAPEHYTEEKTYQDGRLIIDTDAEVIVPDADHVDVISVTAQKPNQELIDKVTKILCNNGKVYNQSTYRSGNEKDMLKQQLDELKQYKAEGNLDPYNFGKDEEGELIYEIDNVIEYVESEYENTPSEPYKEEVTPAIDVNNGMFCGIVEQGDTVYTYMIHMLGAGDENAKTIEFNYNIFEDVTPAYIVSSWMNADNMMEESNVNHKTEEELETYMGISYKEAKDIADAKAEEFGLEGMEMNKWNYSLCIDNSPSFVTDDTSGRIVDERIKDGGYEFHYTRKIDGVPINYTEHSGLDRTSFEIEPWGYEMLNITVGSDGIKNISFNCPYHLGDTTVENVKLMDFEEIINIYNEMLEIQNADMMETNTRRTYHIRRIELGYGRVYNPNSDGDEGILVPVWDFYGGVDVEESDFTAYNSGEHTNYNQLRINAVDGTIINTAMGY